MQVFLIKDLPDGRGKAGEIITVNDGYARNFVIKNRYGRAVDGAAVSQVKAREQSVAFHKNQEIASYREIIAQLAQTTVELGVRVGANGKMFGSVTAHEIASNLNEQGFNIDKKQLITEHVKDVGAYKIKVKFPHGLEGQFALEVKSGN